MPSVNTSSDVHSLGDNSEQRRRSYNAALYRLPIDQNTSIADCTIDICGKVNDPIASDVIEKIKHW